MKQTKYTIYSLHIVFIVIICSLPFYSWSQDLCGHEYVDLGLPSGTLWAKCNIGAKTEKEPGTFFAWGEIKSKDQASYSMKSYRFIKTETVTHQVKQNKYTITKYNNDKALGIIDNKSELESNDDAAIALWGDAWSMPTVEQYEELTKECKWEKKWDNGQNIIIFTGKNNNSIIFPVYGCVMANVSMGDRPYMDSNNSKMSSLDKSQSRYWTKTLNSRMPGAAWSLQVGSPYWDVQQFGRHNGANIKPVVSKKGLTQIKDVYEEYAKSGETFILTDLFPFDVRTYYIIGQFESNANAMQELSKKIESKYNALKATPTMIKAHNEGNGTLAHFLLGYCFYKGLGIKQDNESSLRCFREGGSKGDFRCTVMMFALGLTSEKNSGDMELLSSAASQGYIPAKMIIAYLLSSNLPNRMFNVKNIKTDREIEVNYHSLLDSKYPEASYIWGKMRNSESPIKVAAYDGLSYAIKEIVAQYDETQNYEEAYKFVRVGERKGIEFDKTQYNRIKINALARSEKAVDVANALREAYIMKEYEFIKKVYQDALVRNVTSGDIVTYYVLASKKIGVKDKQDEKQYFNLIKDAAEDGCANAMFVLAESYEKGFGIESIDMNSAIMWYKKAAQGGSSNAQKYLKGRNLKW